MNLSPEDLVILNRMLQNTKLDIPSFRREVCATGLNYKWLQKHIGTRNKELDPKLKELLRLT